MRAYVLGFQEIDKTMLTLVGGKGAGLGELFGIAGINVPAGFCVTTEAYRDIIENNKAFQAHVAQLDGLQADDRKRVAEAGAKLRDTIESIVIPQSMADEIGRRLSWLGMENAYAVRSSATAEDLPTASFAGQQDTYLNIVGGDAILKHISRCWASLFTDRAIIYRIQNGFDHRKVRLAVVVQQMVLPQTSGILFTADPVSSNRKVLSIDASFGLGEALVSGLVNADVYKVRDGKIVGKQVSTKNLSIEASKEGGTQQREVAPGLQNTPALNDKQILQLEHIGRKIEAHFGRPQDIEWCCANDTLYIVQSRPITTLYPVPPESDARTHAYVSVGHQQMMTDAMKPLGISFFRMTSGRAMPQAGGRLFVDITEYLTTPEGKGFIDVLGKYDLLLKDALATLQEREEFKLSPSAPQDIQPAPDFNVKIAYDPAVVPELIRQSRISLDELEQAIQTKSGTDLLDFIQEDLQQLRKRSNESKSFGVIMTGMNASVWLNENMEAWLGEKNAADVLAQSVANNVTSAMGLALLDVADVIRQYPQVIDYLQSITGDRFLDALDALHGGSESKAAIQAFLDQYGMRCAGEIDITKPRWSEEPATLVPLILTNVRRFEPHAGSRKFEQGRRQAEQKEQELLTRLKQLPEGEQKAAETKLMIDLVRNYSGYREYPKYNIVSRYFVYKQALLQEAGRLVQSGLIQHAGDIYYLFFEELREAICTQRLEGGLISRRRDEYKAYEKLVPPRLMTSEGEIITGKYKRENLPANAIVGLPVSSGVIEGRARVILNMEAADLHEGDILVTAFTDPSWTPLFVSIKALVTEVGGLMTHGAVIAREYGLPAVVSVEHATRLIKDGQRIRVNGSDGYVEILP